MKWESIDELLKTLCLLDKDGGDEHSMSMAIEDRLREGTAEERKLIARHSGLVVKHLEPKAIWALKTLNDSKGGDYIRQAKQEGAACNFWDSS